MGKRVDKDPILPNLTISITYSYTAGKNANKTKLKNEWSKENCKTNLLWKISGECGYGIILKFDVKID